MKLKSGFDVTDGIAIHLPSSSECVPKGCSDRPVEEIPAD